MLNAEWTINIDQDGRILNSGGVLFNAPPADVTLPGAGGILEAATAAVRTVSPQTAVNFKPLTTMRMPEKEGAIRLTSPALTEDIEGELVWYAVRGAVRPAWLVYVTGDDAVSRYAVVIDNDSRVALAKDGLTMFQSAPRGQVFERDSPQPNPRPGILQTSAPPVVERTVQSFAGDPRASAWGWVTNNSTIGNNAVVGENLLGISFLTTPDTTTAAGGDFRFPLLLGPGLNPLAYKDAVNVNLFYWINRAHDLHYLSGFDEAAGNFQKDNYGRGGTGNDPIYAYTHYGAANVGGRAQILNAFFSLRRVDDGAQPMVAMFLGRPGPFGVTTAASLFTDGSLDAGVIVHEYTHGVSFRLARQVYQTFQGAAMGEAWSDFFALEYMTPAGAPPDGVYPLAEYFDQSWGTGDLRTRPYSTSFDINPLTYANLGNVIAFPEVHADGEIWFEALWDARANLIRQYGETEGRRRIRLLVLDGMKLSPPASSMVDMRDAILLADRVDFKGASQDQIWAAFAKRGLGATAYTEGGDTAHVVASFDLPSSTGKLKFHEDTFVIGEPVRVILQDSNYSQPSVPIQLTSTSGDVENLVLARSGSVYTGIIGTSGNVVNPRNGTLNITPGDFIDAFYVDADAGSGSKLVTTSAKTRPAYTAITVGPSTPPISGELKRPINGSLRIDLPFSFPFFEGKYTSATVDENGALFFDRAAVRLTACTDSSALGISKMIAPLWSRLTTQGSAQANEGIFTSFTAVAGAVPALFTIRWAGETLNVSALTGGRGSPVNFSVTLASDGTISFSYGSGNAEIGLALPAAAGCNAAPTVGISNGHDFFTQSYSLASYANTSLRLDPPFNTPSYPNGTVDSPAEGGRVQGVMTVAGVAWDPGAAISRVDIFVDGVEHGRAATGQASTGFCATQSVPGCPRVGYTASLDLAARGIAPGAHTLRIRVTNTRGASIDFPEQPVRFTVDAGQSRLPYGKVESVAEGDTLNGTVVISGYAAADDLRVQRVDAIIDGISYGNATYGFARADVCATLNPAPPNCPAIGYRFTLNTRTGGIPLADGAHQLQMRVQDETGRLTLIPDKPVGFTVKNDTPQPVGDMTSPKTNDTVTGTIAITGYAYVPGGKVTGGFVLLDGAVWDAITYGSGAPEVCASLPAVTACPNIGFTVKFDTTRIPNGPHILGVAILTDVGGNITVPVQKGPGINVLVKN